MALYLVRRDVDAAPSLIRARNGHLAKDFAGTPGAIAERVYETGAEGVIIAPPEPKGKQKFLGDKSETGAGGKTSAARKPARSLGDKPKK